MDPKFSIIIIGLHCAKMVTRLRILHSLGCTFDIHIQQNRFSDETVAQLSCAITQDFNNLLVPLLLIIVVTIYM